MLYLRILNIVFTDPYKSSCTFTICFGSDLVRYGTVRYRTGPVRDHTKKYGPHVRYRTECCASLTLFILDVMQKLSGKFVYIGATTKSIVKLPESFCYR